MGFQNLNLKYVYDSDEDDILNDFYIPALSESVHYKRLAGSFSSSALAVAARGISHLIKNGGTMQIVAGAELRPADVDAIMRGLKKREEVIADIMIKDLESIEDEFVKDHVKALAWMVANGRLQIKIAIVLGNDGAPLDKETVQLRGIFHPKIGILEDKEGDIITFGGSINESMRGWLYNDENFYVFRGWIDTHKQYTDKNLQKFETCWNGLPNRFIVLDVPTAYSQQLIKIAPAKIEELNLEKWYLNRGASGTYYKFNPSDLTPWVCQKRAVEAIRNNNYNGILKMATGTGKTSCALFILQSYLAEKKNDDKGKRIMILVPSGKDRLGGQWEFFLRKNVSSKDYIFRYDSETTTDEKRDLIRLWKDGLDSESNLYVIMTIQSLGNFPVDKISPDFLIADEVHEYGTSNRMEIIIKKLGIVNHKIGLSATPERFYDEDGTERILNYFGPIVFRYTIKEAQSEEKYPGSETVLSNYLYNVFVTYLTDEEEKKVKELTQEIGKKINIQDDPTVSERKGGVSPQVERLLQLRARVVKTAENKIIILRNILKERGRHLKQCIVYCEDIEQLNQAEEIFKTLGLTSYVKYHYEVETRAESLELFKENNCNFILSINCLDQGIDIPSCESLIILSGSTNPRQYIQRRGRVLRNYKNKPLVNIYDILAFPREVNEGYLGIVKSQLLRAWEFIEASQSPEEKAKLIDIRTVNGITSEELGNEVRGW